jgi:hypothetical protein
MGEERDGSKTERKSDRNQKVSMENSMLSVKIRDDSTRKEGSHHQGGPGQREMGG